MLRGLLPRLAQEMQKSLKQHKVHWIERVGSRSLGAFWLGLKLRVLELCIVYE